MAEGNQLTELTFNESIIFEPLSGQYLFIEKPRIIHFKTSVYNKCMWIDFVYTNMACLFVLGLLIHLLHTSWVTRLRPG